MNHVAKGLIGGMGILAIASHSPAAECNNAGAMKFFAGFTRDFENLEVRCDFGKTVGVVLADGTYSNLIVDGCEKGIVVCDDVRLENAQVYGNSAAGITMIGRNSKVTGSAAYDNGRGFLLADGAERNTIASSFAHSNDDVGFEIADADRNKLTGNVAAGNLIGFAVRGESNSLTKNTAVGNYSQEWSVSGVDTKLLRNTAAGGWAWGFGIESKSVGARLRGNKAIANRHYGIVVQSGAKGTTLASNHAFGNRNADVQDEDGCSSSEWHRTRYAVKASDCIE